MKRISTQFYASLWQFTPDVRIFLFFLQKIVMLPPCVSEIAWLI